MFRPSTLAATPPLPLLITGISGVPGYNALPYFRQRYPGQVIGIRQRDNWRLTGPGIVVCDAEDRERLERLFDEYHFAAVLDCAGNCALKSCELDPGDGLADQRRGRAQPAGSLPRSAKRGSCICRSIWSFPAPAAAATSKPIRPIRSPSTAKRWSPPRSLILAAPSRGLHPAHLAADGRQLQRPCRRDRLDSIAVQKIEARHALLRRNPHADLHRLPERTVRSGAGQRPERPVPRRRPAPLEPVQIAQIINRVGGYDPNC